ncbi:hypothetical protein [Paraburkholderia elongata]|uniref:hypothetical protein n=1 Tax=Paraburkholderia elongata TaxID=2675747 RepID=UPI001F294E0A|nr:hypothetical protein [Paraburkholderia elongata]
MSYEPLRPAKLLIEVESKYIGFNVGRKHRAGKKVKVQRSPANPGIFIIWFGKAEVAQVPALRLAQTVEYTDDQSKL